MDKLGKMKNSNVILKWISPLDHLKEEQNKRVKNPTTFIRL